MIKLFLDDERQVPDNSWLKVKTVKDAINFLKNNIVDIISLDHDLGTDKECGYDVLLWIEEQVFTNSNFVLPEIKIHTANPSARIKMKLALKRITKKYHE